MQTQSSVQQTYVENRTREFVVADLAAAAHFWDFLMAFLGWRRVDDGMGAIVYTGGSTAVIFSSGTEWDQAQNDAQRVSAFAHLAFDLQTDEELTSLRASLCRRAGIRVSEPQHVLDGEAWRRAFMFRDPNGLDVEVRCPAE